MRKLTKIDVDQPNKRRGGLFDNPGRQIAKHQLDSTERLHLILRLPKTSANFELSNFPVLLGFSFFHKSTC